LREFNFREKLEEKNESRKKYFGFLSSGAKQKNQKVQSAKNIEVLVKKLKFHAPP
jgi:hypothetical protein